MPVITLERSAAHDIEYYLDCAIECFHITPYVYFWAYNLCPNITEIIDGFDKDPLLADIKHPYKHLVASGKRLEQHYIEWQKTAKPGEVELCLAYGMRYLPKSPNDIIKEFIGDLVIQKGGMADIVFDSDVVVYETDTYRVVDYHKKFDRLKEALSSFKRIQDQWCALEYKPNFSEYEIVHKRRNFISREEAIAAIVDYKPKQKTIPKETRKALKRSSDLFDQFNGEGSTKLYLSGKEIIISGTKYDFKLSKQGSLTTSHGSCKTDIYEIGTSNKIASLCVYTPNVTVFDHMVSIILHCKAGLEDTIVNESNIIKSFDQSKLPKQTIDRMNRSTDDFLYINPKVRELNEQYIQKATRKLLPKVSEYLYYREPSLEATITGLLHNVFVSHTAIQYTNDQILLEPQEIDYID